MELKKAIKVLTDRMKNDEDYREGWIANIAMAYKDNEHWYKNKTGKKYLNYKDKHIIANDAAEHFLKILCDEYNYPEGR